MQGSSRSRIGSLFAAETDFEAGANGERKAGVAELRGRPVGFVGTEADRADLTARGLLLVDDGFEELCHIVTEEDPDTALCGKDVTGYPWNPPWPRCEACVAVMRGEMN